MSSSALASDSSTLATSIFPLPSYSSDESADSIVVCKQEENYIYIVRFSIVYVRTKFFALNSALETITQFLSICLQKS